jgi:glucose/arabinose dehydrogenase
MGYGSIYFCNMKKYILYSLVLIIALSCKKEPVYDKDAKLVTQEWLKDLVTPWQLAFASDGRIFFNERPGRVRYVENGQLKTWLNLSNVVEQTESGLLGIALDPNFATNKYVYIAYTYSIPGSPFVNRIVRCKEDPTSKTGFEEKILIDSIKGQQNHNGGPIKFGPDGKLYWTVGDGFDDSKPQDLNSLNGKILRMNGDGTIPLDNPFPNSYIWSYGHRNVQGLAWQPGTNQLFVTEHGPSSPTDCCLDEINVVDKGNNYGWPIIRGSQTKPGMINPIFTSGGNITWAPAGAIFVKNGRWKGSFLFVGLRGETLYRGVIDPSNNRKILRVEEYLKQTYGRLRDIAEAPDGTFYICVSNRDGRGAPKAQDDRIIKLTVE